MGHLDAPRDLVRDGAFDAELAALLWLLLEARTPLVAVGRDVEATGRIADALAAFLPSDARTATVAPDDEFAWLPEAAELGWRRETRAGLARPVDPGLRASDGVLLVRGLGAPGGVTGERARVVVRALALGYGLLATMDGDGLDDALNALDAPPIGTDTDERSRLGLVLAVTGSCAAPRVVAAHLVRPVALDTHGHLQRLPPAVLATWNPGGARFDHFSWGVLPDLAGRLGLRPVDLEREQARRAQALHSR